MIAAAPKLHLFYFFFLGSLCFVSFGLVFVVFIFIIIYYYYYLLLVVVAVVIMVVRLVFCFPLVSSDVLSRTKKSPKKNGILCAVVAGVVVVLSSSV